MTADELRKTYLKFFEGKGHVVIPSASLVPQNDPTVLFTTAGMHPLVNKNGQVSRRRPQPDKCWRC